jgi:hypothetical protein
MVEGYALKEVLGFCTKYLQDFTITRWWMWNEKEMIYMNDK